MVQKPPARRWRHQRVCLAAGNDRLKKIEPTLLSGVNTPSTKEPVHEFAGG
jgi:hypothetical protein